MSGGPLFAPAEALVAVIASLGIPAELWEPQMLPGLPCGSVGAPRLRRTGPEDPESQLTADDWYVDYIVSLYFDLSDVQPGQQQMVETLQRFVAALDADRSLDATVLDAGVTDAAIFTEQRENRTLHGYQITVTTLLTHHPTAP